ncbi:MAG: DUF1573 domain-containing protein [Sphingobacteriales bacterium]|nr:DUF1573 domain-containing protein [Sphingobacteriales bacterium]
MKKIFLMAAAFVLVASAKAQVKPDDIAKFSEESHDFGKVKQNVPAVVYFEIKNISDKPITVESATASCGCTVPEKPEAPIEPGKTAKLKVQYNAAAVAPFTKDVYVKLSGTDQMKTLHITGEVLTPEAYEAYMKEKMNTPPAKTEKPKN